MACISEIKSRDDPLPTSDYVEVVLAPGESAADFEIVVYLRNGTQTSVTALEAGTLTVLPDGSQVFNLPIQTWEWSGAAGPAAIALVSEPDTVAQFVAVGTTNVTAIGGPADGMTATGVGNSDPGQSHFWAPDGSYTGANSSTPGTICFAKGTSIATREGACLVENLVVGDRILTRDNGYKRLKWIGKAHRTRLETARHTALRPVIIRRDAFGLGCPSRDLVVSQQHRILSQRVKNNL